MASIKMVPTKRPSIHLELLDLNNTKMQSQPVPYEHSMKETFESANIRDIVHMYDDAVQGKHT